MARGQDRAHMTAIGAKRRTSGAAVIERLRDEVLDLLAEGPLTLEALAGRLAQVDPAAAAQGREWLARWLARQGAVERVGDRYRILDQAPDDEVRTPGDSGGREAVPVDRTIAQRYVVLDLETNADRGSATEHEIIELAAIRVEQGRPTDRFVALAQNTRPLAEATREKVPLDDDALASAPALETVLKGFLTFVGQDPLIAHNGLGYDFEVLEAACARHALPAPPGERLDTLDLAHVAFPRAGSDLLPGADGSSPPPSRSLEDLARHLGISDEPQRHRALADVELLLKVMDGLLARLTEPRPSMALVRWVLQAGAHPWAAFLPQELDRPSLVEVLPTSDRQDRPAPTGRFDVDSTVNLLRPGGKLLGGGRQYRSQQADMAETVAVALHSGRRQLIEAPTGTGKTLGYLVPAVAYARASGATVVVASHSKVLQNQVVSTLAELAPAFGPVRSVLLKGRENYISLSSLDGLLDQPPGDPDAALATAIICSWVCQTPTGEWDDLRVWAIESRLEAFRTLRWRLRVDSPPSIAEDELDDLCFYRRALEDLDDAEIAVLNHAVLVSRNDWLDGASHLILDEAHNFEESATAALTGEVSEASLRRLVDFVHDEDERWGTLGRWLDATATSVRSDPAQRVLAARRAVLSAAKVFSDALIDYVRDRSAVRRQDVERFGASYRIQPYDVSRPAYVLVKESARELRSHLRDLADALGSLEVPQRLRGRYRRRRLEAEIARIGREANNAGDLIDDVIFATDADTWISIVDLSIVAGRHRWTLRRVPITVGPHLRDLWDALDAVVLTSATLRVGGSYDHIQKRLGLEIAKVTTLGTPFAEIPSRELLVLPDHLPTPSGALLDEFSFAESDELARLLTVSQGRALALFTSRARMQQAWKHVQGQLESAGLSVLCQDMAPAPALVERMITETSTSLFATRSFWEGVDVPGEALSLLVVEKLPFDSPADPVVSARVDQLERQGKDPFREYLVPNAVIRFAQGVGRLIRSNDDIGAVVVLDKRLRRPTMYRHWFLESLPGPPRTLRPLTPEEGYAAIADHLSTPWDESVRARLGTLETSDPWADLPALQLDDREAKDPAVVDERLEEVRQRFGFDSWRAGQLDVMRRLIRGDDVIAVLPTGAGKSLTYQIPALLRPGLTVVVSPLVALMRDQVRSLRERGVLSVAAIHTGQSQQEQEEYLAGARAGRYRLLYVSPERLWTRRFREGLAGVDIARVAIDEAHCMSQWGHSFRPEYAAIADAVHEIARASATRPAIAALTATATPEVQKEVARLLRLDLSDPVIHSPDRPELRYHVVDCADFGTRDLTVVRIAEAYRDQPVIVYVPRRVDTSRIAGLLRSANHRARPYHGGMEAGERLHTEEAFLDGEISVVVATKAFGLGIDKPDVAAVVHLEMPASVEEYIQETGRAARGARSGIGPPHGDCILLRTPRDCRIHTTFIRNAAPSIEDVRAVWHRVSDASDVWRGPVEELLDGERDSAERAAVAASYLVRAGVLERGEDLAWAGRVWLPGDVRRLVDELTATHPKLGARAQRVLALANRLGTEEYHPLTWSKELGLSPAETESLLLELMRRDVLAFYSWQTAWELRPSTKRPEWHALERQLDERRQAVAKLSRSAKEYRGQQTQCRRAWLLSYLGAERSARCQGCDVCDSALDRPWEAVQVSQEALNASIPAIFVILVAVRDTQAQRYSRQTVELMLAGKPLRFAATLMEHHLYGALQALGRDGVARAVERAVLKGLVDVIRREGPSGSYESLQLTDAGKRML